MAISMRGRPLRKGQSSQGVPTASSTSEIHDLAQHALGNRILERKDHRGEAELEIDRRLRFLRRQSARISVAAARSLPIGFWISTAAPSGACRAPRDGRPGGVARS